jgi:APA family basic amino acid/polyamine antiporter
MLMNYTKGLVDAFTFVILLATLTTLVPYAYSAAAQAYLYITERERFQPRHFLRDIVVAALAFAYSVWAIAGSGQEIIAKGFVLLLAGVPIYVGMRWWQQRDAGRTAVATPPRAYGNGKPATERKLVAVGTAAGPEGNGHDA